MGHRRSFRLPATAFPPIARRSSEIHAKVGRMDQNPLGAHAQPARFIGRHAVATGLTVITGPSGSGKSSLAFDTLFAEGRRRYPRDPARRQARSLPAIAAPRRRRHRRAAPRRVRLAAHRRPPGRAARWRPSPRFTIICACCGPASARRIAPIASCPIHKHTLTRDHPRTTLTQDGRKIFVLAPLVQRSARRSQGAFSAHSASRLPACPRRWRADGDSRYAEARREENAHDRADRRSPGREADDRGTAARIADDGDPAQRRPRHHHRHRDRRLAGRRLQHAVRLRPLRHDRARSGAAQLQLQQSARRLSALHRLRPGLGIRSEADHAGPLVDAGARAGSRWTNWRRKA